MTETRWAVLSTGGIAETFARCLPHARGARLVSVCSRGQDTAEAFARRFAVPHATTDLTASLEQADALYVASPHPMHAEPVRAALENGTAVMCEKPLAMRAAQARELAALAHARGTFLMEAMWTRFVPAVREAHRLIAAGRIGPVRRLCAEFAIDAPFDHPDYGPRHRLYAPALGGGALHDLGVYPLHAALAFLGHPDAVTGSWTPAPTGVDAEADVRLDYADGRVAYLTCGFGGAGANLCIIEGERGSIVLDATFIGAQRLWVVPNRMAPLWGFGRGGGAAETFRRLARRVRLPGVERVDMPFAEQGLQFEIEAAGDAIRGGHVEHEWAPLRDTVRVLEVIEEVLN